MMMRARFEAMLKSASSIDWRFELALVLARETGHRIGAIRMLRWNDVDFAHARIHWRADADKIGFEHTVPASEAALEALRAALHRRQAIGGAWVFLLPRARRSRARGT
jgi:integrase